MKFKLTDAQWWRYCSTSNNPADILTRGCTVKNLVRNNFWWSGAHWLAKCEDAWPTAKLALNIGVQNFNLACELHLQTKGEPVLDLRKYSSLVKLFNVTVYVFHFFESTALFVLHYHLSNDNKLRLDYTCKV
ncbi:hypothetical protein T4E_2194 [Trichinella pseudospiralis]|uniref:Uncharacterized protein n=1 Tax=Trichinella pseudospiralis TaxID=6337 RepID=A0A0V0Y617_TRIPS|nr:hypothetical protein T4E_2194 [Trichinella pseudospiralis]